MRKNFKRWLALTLAVIMVISTCMVSSDNFLRATDEAATVAEDSGAVVDETEVGSDAVTPDAGETEPVAETPVEETQEIVIPQQEPVQEEAAPETPVAEAGDVALGQEVDVIPSESEEDTYNVVFYRPAVEGGTLRVWTDGSGKKDVTYTDGKYVEEVKEGTTLYFEIESTGNYLVDSVKDQNGVEIAPTEVNENVSSYSMVINENKELTIMYKEAPKEESDEVEEEEASAEEEELLKAPMSRAIKAPRANRTVKVGEKTTLTGAKNNCDKNHDWKVVSGDGNIVKMSGSGSNITVTGKKAGTVTIRHTYCDIDNWPHSSSSWNHNKSGTEDFTVKVQPRETQDPQRVYIYVRMDSNKVPDGWNVNSQGYYTVGYVDVEGLPSAEDFNRENTYNDYLKKVSQAVGNGANVVRHKDNQGIYLNFDKIEWTALKVEGGAAGYGDDISQNTWHLDGWLDIEAAEIIIKGNTDTLSYAGTEQSVEGFGYEVNLPTGADKNDIQVSLKNEAKAKASRTEVGKTNMGLTANDFIVTSSRYNPIKIKEVEDGWLEITPTTGNEVKIENYTGTYDGKEHGLKSANATKNGSTVLYATKDPESAGFDEENGWSETAPTFTEAGSHTVWVKATNLNYADTEVASGTVTINKKAVTITVNNKQKNYGEVDPTFDGSITPELVNEEDLGDVTYSRIEADKDKNNVGDNITLTASYKNNPNYDVEVKEGTLTIVAATGNSVTVVGDTVTYNGEAHGLTAKADKPGSTLWYATKNPESAGFDEEKGWSETAPTFKDAGSHTVWVKATNPNYADTAVASGTVTINKKAVTITVNNKQKNYGEVDPTFDGSITPELVNEGDLGDVTYSRIEEDKDKNNVGDNITLTASYTDNPNYEVTVTDGTLTINQTTIEIPPTPGPDARFEFTGDMPEDKVYNGRVQNWTPTISDNATQETLVAGTDYTVSYFGGKNVGNVTVKIEGMGNYKGEVTRFYKITEAPLSVSTPSVSRDYDGTPLTAEGTLEGLVNGETVTFRTTGTITEEGETENTYEIVWDGTADKTNYKIVNENLGTLTVTRPYYTLTINYMFNDGTVAAPAFTQRLLRGETYSQTSPAVDGYTPDYAFVRSDANGIQQNMTFTVTYTANAAPAVVTPVGPAAPAVTPVAPAVPAAPAAPAAPAVVPAPDAPVPGAMLVATDDGDVEVVPVVDEEVPLANRDLDEHECCILHFLLMLAAILILAGYTHSMKKRQKRIAELAEELETELLKREQEKAE